MVALIYFPSGKPTSIIDWNMLNFCIRNGNRCFHTPHQHHRLERLFFNVARYKIQICQLIARESYVFFLLGKQGILLKKWTLYCFLSTQNHFLLHPLSLILCVRLLALFSSRQVAFPWVNSLEHRLY